MTSNGDLWSGGGSQLRPGTARSATLGNTPERGGTPGNEKERSATLGRQRNKSGPKRVTFKLESDVSPKDVSGGVVELADGMPSWWPRPTAPGPGQTTQQTASNSSSSVATSTAPPSITPDADTSLSRMENAVERLFSLPRPLSRTHNNGISQNTYAALPLVNSHINDNVRQSDAYNPETSGNSPGSRVYSEPVMQQRLNGPTETQPTGGTQQVPPAPTWWPKSSSVSAYPKPTEPEYYDNTSSNWQTKRNCEDLSRIETQPPNPIATGHIGIEFRDLNTGSDGPRLRLMQQRQRQRASSVDTTDYQSPRDKTFKFTPQNQRASLSPQLARNSVVNSERSRTIQSSPTISPKRSQPGHKAFDPSFHQLPTDGTTAVFTFPIPNTNTAEPNRVSGGTIPTIVKSKESDSTHPTEEDFWHRSPKPLHRVVSSQDGKITSFRDGVPISPKSRSDIVLSIKPSEPKQQQEYQELTRKQLKNDRWKTESVGSSQPPPLPQRNDNMHPPPMQQLKSDFQPHHQQQMNLSQRVHSSSTLATQQDYQRQQDPRHQLEEHEHQQQNDQLKQQRLRKTWNSPITVSSKLNTTGDDTGIPSSIFPRNTLFDHTRSFNNDTNRTSINNFDDKKSDNRQHSQRDQQTVRTSTHDTNPMPSMCSNNNSQGHENSRLGLHFSGSEGNNHSTTPQLTAADLVAHNQKPALPPRNYLLSDLSSRTNNSGLMSPSGSRRTFQESFQSPPPQSFTSSPSPCPSDSSTITLTQSDSGFPSPSLSDSTRWSTSEKSTLADTKKSDSGQGSPHPLDDELEICLRSVEEAMASLQDSVQKNDINQRAEAGISRQEINRSVGVSPMDGKLGADWRRRSYDGESLENNRERTWKGTYQEKQITRKLEEEQGRLVSPSPFSGLNPLQHNVRHLWTAGENNSANWTRLVVGDWLLGSENNAHEVVSRQIALWEGQPQEQGLLQGRRSICGSSHRGYSPAFRDNSPGRGYTQTGDRRVRNHGCEDDPEEVGSQISRIGMESRQKHRSIAERMSLSSAVSPCSEPSGSLSPPQSSRTPTPSLWQPDTSTSHPQNRKSPARQRNENYSEILYPNQNQQHLQQQQQQQQQPYQHENSYQQNYQQEHQYEQHQQQQQAPWQPNASLPWQKAVSSQNLALPWQPHRSNPASSQTSADFRCDSGFGQQPHATQYPGSYNNGVSSTGLTSPAPVSPGGRQMETGNGRWAAPLSPSGSVISVDWNQLFETSSELSSVADDQLSCTSEVAPLSRPEVVRWYHQTQLPRGVGVDALTGRAAPWFHGVVGRPEAELRLLPCPPGAYLVRCSLRIWGYTLSYRCQNRCKHFLVEASQHGYRFYGNPERQFRTLDELLRYHTIQPITSQGAELLRFPCTNHTNTTASQLVA